MAKIKTTGSSHPLQQRASVRVLIHNKNLQIIIVLASIFSIFTMAYLATTNAYTSGWIASILLTPLVLLAFTGLIRRVAWNIAPVLIFLTFWPLGIVYIIQKISNPKSELRNNLLYWIIPFSWAFLTEWFLVVFGILIILLAPING